MFPTTVWTSIRRAGEDDGDSLRAFAEGYRPAVLAYVRARGFDAQTAEDLCQDVFVRVLRGGVLGKADPARGRFRSLMLTVTTRVIQDHLRRDHVRHDHARSEAERALARGEPERVEEAPDFDRAWAWHVTERALARLREQGSPYHQVLVDHLEGRATTRNRLWIARKKLSAAVRAEVASTCASHEDFEQEIAYLARFLRPAGGA